ncbi:MAG: hypothetical protein ACRCUS_06460 [Anaerovoracaceae bacterium]
MLKNIGISKYIITIDKSKIVKIRNMHKEVSPKIFKELPRIINKPILIMKSQTDNNSIVLLGEVSANKKPVFVSFKYSIFNNKNEVLNYGKITSIYTKKQFAELDK